MSQFTGKAEPACISSRHVHQKATAQFWLRLEAERCWCCAGDSWLWFSQKSYLAILPSRGSLTPCPGSPRASETSELESVQPKWNRLNAAIEISLNLWAKHKMYSFLVARLIRMGPGLSAKMRLAPLAGHGFADKFWAPVPNACAMCPKLWRGMTP